MEKQWKKCGRQLEIKLSVALNKHESPDRDEFLPEVLREFANMNIAHFWNLCIITKKEKLPIQKKEEIGVFENYKTDYLGVDF